MDQTTLKLRDVLGENLKVQEPLAKYTTFKVGGPADWFYDAQTTDGLVTAVNLSRSLQLPFFILGGGTNLLIGDKGFRGIVIKNSARAIMVRGIKAEVKNGEAKRKVFVEADSGVLMNSLVRFTEDQGLKGLEMHLGLPGTVGGAVFMNSKWTHPEGYVGDVVYQAVILTPGGEITTVPRDYFRFGYDTSTIQHSGDIVLKVVFMLEQSTKEELWQIANESMEYRRRTQPQGVFTAGCTFRNISQAQALVLNTPNHTTSAGFLIDHAGMKGKQIGGAQISSQHANFIVNTKRARAADIVSLIEQSRAAVKKQFGVELEEEIIRVGEF